MQKTIFITIALIAVLAMVTSFNNVGAECWEDEPCWEGSPNDDRVDHDDDDNNSHHHSSNHHSSKSNDDDIDVPDLDDVDMSVLDDIGQSDTNNYDNLEIDYQVTITQFEGLPLS